jgi:hypothetical protein
MAGGDRKSAFIEAFSRSADFQVCCTADFQIGAPRKVIAGAGLEARDTADLEVCVTKPNLRLPRAAAFSQIDFKLIHPHCGSARQKNQTIRAATGKNRAFPTRFSRPAFHLRCLRFLLFNPLWLRLWKMSGIKTQEPGLS